MKPHWECWVIYDHPIDFPDHYVARKFLDDHPTDYAVMSPSLDAVRTALPPGMIHFPRMPADEPQIVECWIKL